MFKIRNKYSAILLAAIFATGFSGIIAEYLLSTLATYFLGDSILQWTMIVSTMMFSMGLGSRISKSFKRNLTEKFLILEFALSLVVSFAPMIVYTVSAFTSSLAVVIYGFSILIGTLIGMEIPLVMRINDEYESLRVNISNVLEKDYYGSLIGGIFFVVLGLPFLGLTYLPFFLGTVNFGVAIGVFITLKKLVDDRYKKYINISIWVVTIVIISGVVTSDPIIKYGEQIKYKDKVIYSEQSQYQKIVITQWENEYWLYLNSNQQLCTMDEVMYHEPLVHPVMTLHPNPQRILILGGGDGCAAREVLKYSSVENIRLVDLDPAMTRLGQEHPILTKMNKGALTNPKVEVINSDGYHYLTRNKDFYDIIIIDLPDPRTVELGRLYSVEFYNVCYKHLRPGGLIITQAGSPYFATKAFKCIVKTMTEAGFKTLPLHNQVITLGEWGWSMGIKTERDLDLKKEAQALEFKNIETQWLNHESMQLITSFGKDIFPGQTDPVKVNRIHDPVLYKYYLKGNWDLY
ncbi:polyamine aminopropyltransferase [Carboxylicivirga linearis]|uniref:Polyamine aminopropyltransferase n=1 Tax=Carboxylicivirga linearis TaxID=1628157 RepID=A0ABS5JQF3_9BACT|nr:polyamine aminopropyltransferase [Carboxylicivirga linearis]MBS2097055.1 polyamine aminopropyltransferase [Carboxylicivirga linearis]